MGVPHASEEFRDWLTFEVIGESADRYWVGPGPRLSVPDESSRYGFISPTDLMYSCMTITLAPFTLRGTETISAQARVDIEPPPGTPAFEVFVSDVDYTFYAYYWEDRATTSWATFSRRLDQFEGYDADAIEKAASMGSLRVGAYDAPWSLFGSRYGFSLSWLDVRTDDGVLAIDTHDHPFHVVGTRDPAMPYELVIDTGTERLVEIVAGEESLATHELVIDETGRAGTPWSHCGLFRPL